MMYFFIVEVIIISLHTEIFLLRFFNSFPTRKEDLIILVALCHVSQHHQYLQIQAYELFRILLSSTLHISENLIWCKLIKKINQKKFVHLLETGTFEDELWLRNFQETVAPVSSF